MQRCGSGVWGRDSKNERPKRYPRRRTRVDKADRPLSEYKRDEKHTASSHPHANPGRHARLAVSYTAFAGLARASQSHATMARALQRGASRLHLVGPAKRDPARRGVTSSRAPQIAHSRPHRRRARTADLDAAASGPDPDRSLPPRHSANRANVRTTPKTRPTAMLWTLRPRLVSKLLQSQCYSTAARTRPDFLRILFCGSDDFSIKSLRALHRARQDTPGLIEAIHVAHRPAKPTGRGLKVLREGTATISISTSTYPCTKPPTRQSPSQPPPPRSPCPHTPSTPSPAGSRRLHTTS